MVGVEEPHQKEEGRNPMEQQDGEMVRHTVPRNADGQPNVFTHIICAVRSILSLSLLQLHLLLHHSLSCLDMLLSDDE